MRGRELLQLIKSLTPKEKDFVRAGFATEKTGKEFARLFGAMEAEEGFDKKAISKRANISERRISSLLPGFGRLVVQSVGMFHQQANQEFETSLSAAWKMVMRLQNGPASAIMLDLYGRASEVERFDVLLELYEMAEAMTERLELPGDGYDAVAARKDNLAAYESLRASLIQFKSFSLAQKQQALQQVGDSELMVSESAAQSVRAKSIYYGLKARLCFYRGDYDAASGYQALALRMLSDHPWLKREPDYYVFKEHETLIALLFASNRNEEANSLIFRVGNMPATQEREELMKWQQLFPQRLTVALYEGNLEKGASAVNDFLSIQNQYGGTLPIRFVTKNLYWVAFYYLCSGDFTSSKRTSIQLLKEGKSTNFDPPFLPMTRILSAVLSYEMGDYEDLIWQDKTFRMTTSYQDTPFYKLVLSLLRKLSLAKSEMHRQELLREYKDLAAKMEADTVVAGYFNYFDFGNWIESKQRQCTMLEVFKARALSSQTSSETPRKKSQR